MPNSLLCSCIPDVLHSSVLANPHKLQTGTPTGPEVSPVTSKLVESAKENGRILGNIFSFVRHVFSELISAFRSHFETVLKSPDTPRVLLAFSIYCSVFVAVRR